MRRLAACNLNRRGSFFQAPAEELLLWSSMYLTSATLLNPHPDTRFVSINSLHRDTTKEERIHKRARCTRVRLTIFGVSWLINVRRCDHLSLIYCVQFEFDTYIGSLNYEFGRRRFWISCHWTYVLNKIRFFTLKRLRWNTIRYLAKRRLVYSKR